jgi:hypothetical protein
VLITRIHIKVLDIPRMESNVSPRGLTDRGVFIGLCHQRTMAVAARRMVVAREMLKLMARGPTREAMNDAL